MGKAICAFVILEDVLKITSHFVESAFLEEFRATFSELFSGDSATFGVITLLPSIFPANESKSSDTTFDSSDNLDERGEFCLGETIGACLGELFEGMSLITSSSEKLASLTSIFGTLCPFLGRNSATFGSITLLPSLGPVSLRFLLGLFVV